MKKKKKKKRKEKEKEKEVLFYEFLKVKIEAGEGLQIIHWAFSVLQYFGNILPLIDSL